MDGYTAQCSSLGMDDSMGSNGWFNDGTSGFKPTWKMDVEPKIGPKMDGENNGKPYSNGWFGGPTPYFWVDTHISNYVPGSHHHSQTTFFQWWSYVTSNQGIKFCCEFAAPKYNWYETLTKEGPPRKKKRKYIYFNFMFLPPQKKNIWQKSTRRGSKGPPARASCFWCCQDEVCIASREAKTG